MSIHMPTLFDDEEYFVPPPKKENRKKKDQHEAKDAALNEAETDAVADPVGSSEPLTEAETQPVVDTDEAAAGITVAEPPVEEVIAVKEEGKEIDPEPEAAIVLPEAVSEEVAEPVAEETPVAIPATTTEAALIEATATAADEPAADEPMETIEEAIEPVATVTDEQESNVIVEVPGETNDAIVTAVAPEQAITEDAPIAEAVTAPAAPESEGADAQILTDETQETTETATVQSIELEEVDVVAENRATDPFQEIVEVSAVDELAIELPQATPGITFEIPEEEEEPAIELEMTARPIPTVREDKVDDLDQLMRTELISQDYTAFSGFAFEPEPEKKKIIPEPETKEGAEEPAAATPQKEDISLAVQEIDAAALDFEFESAALASSLPDFALEDKYYTIGEVAGLFGVNVSHIRFWTTEFNLKVRTTRKGDRLYNPENIARLRLIHHLVKENGFTIKGAKEKLKHQKQNVSSQIDLKNKLSGLKDKLERIKKNL